MAEKIHELIDAMQALSDAVFDAWLPADGDAGDRNVEFYATPHRQEMLRETRIREFATVRQKWAAAASAVSPAMAALERLRISVADVKQKQDQLIQWARLGPTLLYPSFERRPSSTETFTFPDIGSWATDGALLRDWLLQHANAEQSLTPVQDGVVVASLPPLSKNAAAVYELLRDLPPHRAMTGAEILNALMDQDIFIDQSTLTKRIVKELKPYGIQNQPRIGYRIPSQAPPKK